MNNKDTFIILTDRESTKKFIDDVRSAADQHRNEFGFLAHSVYEEFWRRDCLHVATHFMDGQQRYAGHLIFDPRYPKVRIIQMFCDKTHRRHGLGSRLISNLKTILVEAGFTSIYARVAEDLHEANAFWARKGFYIQRVTNGGASRNRKILVRCHELESPQLFPASGIDSENPLGLLPARGAIPLFLLDLNVLFDSIGPRRLRHGIVSGLFQAERIGLCKLAISSEIQEELGRNSPQSKTDPMLEYAKLFPTFPLLDGSAEKTLLAKLADIVFPSKVNLSNNDKSDLRHLAAAIQNNLAGLITSDNAILSSSSAIRNEFSIDVVSPDIFAVDGDLIGDNDAFEVSSCEQLKLASVEEHDAPAARLFLSRIGITGAEAVSGWIPMTTAVVGRAVWDNEKMIGYSSWSSDISDVGLVAHVALDESHPEAMNAGRILLTFLLDNLPGAGLRQMTINIPTHQSYLRELANSLGFRGMSNQRSLTKLFLGSILVPMNWSIRRKEIINKIGLKLPENIPLYHGPDQHIEIITPGGNKTFQQLDELETLLSPGLICLNGRPAVITPIQRQFSEELLGHSSQISFLPLRSAKLFKEKHYLCSKKNLNYFKRGTLILFYESAKRNGRKGIVAMARCRHSYLASEDKIEERDLEKSVLTRESLGKIGKSKMKTIAVFDNIHTFRKPVPYGFLKKIGCGKDTDLISTRSISDIQLQAILEEALA